MNKLPINIRNNIFIGIMMLTLSNMRM